MKLQRALEDAVADTTVDVPGLVGEAVRRGRSRRRQRRGGIALAAVAVLGLGAAGLQLATNDGGRTVVRDTPVAAPAPSAPEDFVPGTGTDEALAAVVADHFPSLPAPDDVYPGCCNIAGPIPDAEFARADGWSATYTLPDGHGFDLMTSAGPFSCPRCKHDDVAGGAIYHQSSHDGNGTWQHGTWYVRDDGSLVAVFEYVPEQADRALSDAALEALAQDPRLTLEALSAAGSSGP